MTLMRNPKKIWEKKLDKWYNQMGQIGTSWSRGTSGTRRNGSLDLSGTSGTRRRGSWDLRGTSGTRTYVQFNHSTCPKWYYKAVKNLLVCPTRCFHLLWRNYLIVRSEQTWLRIWYQPRSLHVHRGRISGSRYGAVGSRVGLIIQRSSVRSRLAADSLLPSIHKQCSLIFPERILTGRLFFAVYTLLFVNRSGSSCTLVYMVWLLRHGVLLTSLWHGGACDDWGICVEMAERSKAAASGAVPLRRARVRTSLSIQSTNNSESLLGIITLLFAHILQQGRAISTHELSKMSENMRINIVKMCRSCAAVPSYHGRAV